MLDVTVVNGAAALLLAAMACYAIVLLINNMRATSLAFRSADAEREFLAARVAELSAHRKFVEERNVLSWNGFRKFTIAQKVQEGGDICSFYLEPHDKKPLPPFEPGQYLTFRLDLPAERKATVRCYSLSDSPKSEHFRVSIKKSPPPRDESKANVGKSSSNFFHDQLSEGEILDVKAPSGHFFLDTTKHTPVVLIGGGVGITPVLSMLNSIVESGSTRETWFFYGIRHGEEHVMRYHLAKLDQENENVHVHVCYSDPRAGDAEGKDYQHNGRVGVDLFKQLLPSNNYDFYFCGPPPMMDSLFEGLRDWGVPEDHIHFEAFGPATVKKVAKPTDAESAAASNIEIVFDKSGKTAAWDPAIGSLLDFAEENEVEIDYGCRAGNCGTCITAIKEGAIDYMQEPGERPEAGSCLACVAVPKGNRLVLDA